MARFDRSPSLTVRLVSLRVRDPRTDRYSRPSSGHRYSVRSFVERTFPVSTLSWSEIAVDAAAEFFPHSRVPRIRYLDRDLFGRRSSTSPAHI